MKSLLPLLLICGCTTAKHRRPPMPPMPPTPSAAFAPAAAVANDLQISRGIDDGEGGSFVIVSATKPANAYLAFEQKDDVRSGWVQIALWGPYPFPGRYGVGVDASFHLRFVRSVVTPAPAGFAPAASPLLTDTKRTVMVDGVPHRLWRIGSTKMFVLKPS